MVDNKDLQVGEIELGEGGVVWCGHAVDGTGGGGGWSRDWLTLGQLG